MVNMWKGELLCFLLVVLSCHSAHPFFHFLPADKNKSTRRILRLPRYSSSSSSSYTTSQPSNSTDRLNDLTQSLDKFILTGSPASREKAASTFREIEHHADDEEISFARRKIQRAGFSVAAELGKTDSEKRVNQVEERKQWEKSRTLTGRSALSERTASTSKPDILMGNVDPGLAPLQRMAGSRQLLENEMNGVGPLDEEENESENLDEEGVSEMISELIARSGSVSGFEGSSLGIGGLDDVLATVKRRIWTPLAAPPQLLRELNLSPVRGLLLYGKPGNGKTLLAQKLGRILSPLRPATVVSGPEIMDKFVGSSEKNLREIFDNPPDVYEEFRKRKDGNLIAKAIFVAEVMDEFDAIARHRGGKGGTGDQGDAGVARDSVVNQLLAKMDGVSPLAVPTLVIGLTNKRSLIDTALLRPGRFEVHIEVPPPKTIEQRVSILKVHTQHMYKSGRLLVRDPPGVSTARSNRAHKSLPTYNELLLKLAKETEGYSGASLASVSRSAASHALERSVEAVAVSKTSLLRDCRVTPDDFSKALEDVKSNGVADSEGEGDDKAIKEES